MLLPAAAAKAMAVLPAAAAKALAVLPAAAEMTKGAAKMARTDPHGWTLTIVSVSVVFTGLLILYFIYSLSGNFFSGRFKRKPKAAAAQGSRTAAAHGHNNGNTPDEEELAAIAMALQAEGGLSDEEIAAAIAVSLYLGDGIHDLGDGVHDAEPGYLTFGPTGSAWADKSLTFRRRPIK